LARNLNVTDRVIFLGFRKDAGDLLAASDLIVCQPAGRTFYRPEAMAAGKPS
jgi:UDP-N-acetylglucosamine:LPS N-acetylglucosamine transferase